MNSYENLNEILRAVKNNKLTIEEAESKLDTFIDLGFAQVDLHREIRTGFPEVIFGEGKSIEQVISIFENLAKNNNVVLATRVSEEKGTAVINKFPDAIYDKIGRTILWKSGKVPNYPGYVAIVCAGTSDIPVALEAKSTLTAMGSKSELISDVGIAGLHRLIDKIKFIRNANVIIVIAGMEGALPSVIGGLVSKPIIAVPTSIGYGANFSGLSSLLGMLNSCANGISVVNIDNGFGAGYQAGLINKLINREDTVNEKNSLL